MLNKQCKQITLRLTFVDFQEWLNDSSLISFWLTIGTEIFTFWKAAITLIDLNSVKKEFSAYVDI